MPKEMTVRGFLFLKLDLLPFMKIYVMDITVKQKLSSVYTELSENNQKNKEKQTHGKQYSQYCTPTPQNL